MVDPLTSNPKLTPQQRWEQGIDHDPRSVEIFRSIEDIDLKENGDYFCWKSGGDGDNGESLMYLLDCHFARAAPDTVDGADIAGNYEAWIAEVFGDTEFCTDCVNKLAEHYARKPTASETNVRMKTGKPSIESCEHDWRDHPTFLAWQSCSRCTLFRRAALKANEHCKECGLPRDQHDDPNEFR